jgi:hypothetical protein
MIVRTCDSGRIRAARGAQTVVRQHHQSHCPGLTRLTEATGRGLAVHGTHVRSAYASSLAVILSGAA